MAGLVRQFRVELYPDNHITVSNYLLSDSKADALAAPGNYSHAPHIIVGRVAMISSVHANDGFGTPLTAP